jgi:membrane-anchored protein YejM (alkaline phosphatase superfamily)
MRSAILWRYYALSAAAILVNLLFNLAFVRSSGAVAPLFVIAVLLTESALFALPALLLALGADRLVSMKRLDGLFANAPRARPAVVYAVAILGTAAVHVFVYFDRFILSLYGYHLNGFVWNLLTTRGGVDALASSGSTKLTFALIVTGFAALQAALLVLLIRVPKLPSAAPRLFSRRGFVAAAVLFVVAVLFEKGAYGLSRYKVYGPVLASAEAFPLYIPCQFHSFAKALGFEEGKAGPSFKVDASTRRLRYPRVPVRRDPAAPKLNVVWLVAESWRWDMLDPEIMPATWAFASGSTRFTRHYSGGNGTRMGVFTMFTGLYGTYWFPCLDAGRGAAVMDVFLDGGWQVDLSTSAMFTYPEFDRTIFSRVPRERMHEGTPGVPGWQCDRENVTRLLEFIGKRDPSRPFMTFMFFESPHGPYNFPEECAIRKPYATDLNYLAMDLKGDLTPIKNRYVNSCRHLDTQFARVVAFLGEQGLLDSTVVILTGDHGEEFMEKGRWGHASEFSEEQVRVPLVVRAPGGKAAVVDRMTSHLDLAPTVMTLLGVTNPPEDYSLGYDLFGSVPREFTIFSGWEHLAYADGKVKADLPVKSWDLVHRKVTTMDDGPLADKAAFWEQSRPALLKVLKDLGRFLD